MLLSCQLPATIPVRPRVYLRTYRPCTSTFVLAVTGVDVTLNKRRGSVRVHHNTCVSLKLDGENRVVKREQLSQSKVVTDGERKKVGVRSELALQVIIVVRVVKAAQDDIRRTKKG